MFNFIKIDGKFKEYFNGFTGKMESNSSNQTLTQNRNRNALTAFLYSCASLTSVGRSNLFNPNRPPNTAFWGLFGESGPLNTKDKRDAFFEIMKTNETSVRDGNVIFSPEFSSRIDSIVSQFLEGIDDSQSSSDVANSAGQPNATVATAGGSAVCQRKPSGKPNATVATAGGGAACQKKTSGQPKEAVATAGGGAVCQRKPSGKPNATVATAGGGAACQKKTSGQPKEAVATAGGGAPFHKGHSTHTMTLADFQAKSQSSKPLKCVLCQHTDKESGRCKFKGCRNSHALNPISVVVQQSFSKNGHVLLLANVCENFNNGTCQCEGNCKDAHIPAMEYAAVVENKRIRRESKAGCLKVSNVSSEKQTMPSVIVPSQVHFGRPSQLSALPASHPFEMPDLSFDPEDPFLGFLDLGFFAGLSSVVSEKETKVVDFSPQTRSYAHAVEVPDSTDEEKNVEGDE